MEYDLAKEIDGQAAATEMNRLRQMYRKKKLKSVQLKNKNKEKPGENPGFFYCTFVLKVVYIL